MSEAGKYDSLGELVMHWSKHYGISPIEVINTYETAFDKYLFKYHDRMSVPMIKQYSIDVVDRYYSINHVPTHVKEQSARSMYDNNNNFWED